MKKSFTYYLTLLVIKIKGIKKNFSQAPINFLELRKNDVYFPKNIFFKSENISTFLVLKTKITQVINVHNSENLLIYIHGGAFISGPTQYHWDSIERIAKNTKLTVWLCDYPKAPENKIPEISINIDCMYEKAIQKYKNIIVMGDSVGGTLIIALTQRLLLKNSKLPSKIILISPVLDASFENPKIDEIDKKDPMLSKKGVLSAKKMCSENDNLKDVRISPIYSSFKNFPKTYLYIAENDITSPDQWSFLAKLNKEKVENIISYGEGMPHIWPLLPVMKESKIALNEIINQINE